MKSKIIQNIKAIILGFLVVVGVGYASAAWNGAPADGPVNAVTNNTSAPINTGYASQIKIGSLWIDGLTSPGISGTYSLRVENAPLKTAGGLILEVRTSTQGDPASPDTGRIWMIN